SPDGKWLAGSNRNGATVWESATGKEMFVIRGKGWIARLTFSQDGRRLAAAGAQHISLWSVPQGVEAGGLPRAHNHTINCVRFSPDSKMLASSSSDKAISFWDAATGRGIFTFTEHTAPVHTVCFSPDGRRLASASVDKTVKVFDAANGSLQF